MHLAALPHAKPGCCCCPAWQVVVINYWNVVIAHNITTDIQHWLTAVSLASSPSILEAPSDPSNTTAHNASNSTQRFREHTTLQRAHNASESTQRFKQHTLLQTTHNTSNSTKRFQQQTMLPTAYNASNSTQCFKQHTMIQTAHNATNDTQHFQQHTTPQTAHNASNSTQCFKQYKTLQTTHNTSNSTQHLKQHTTLPTAHNASSSTKRYKQHTTLQTAHKAAQFHIKSTLFLFTYCLSPGSTSLFMSTKYNKDSSSTINIVSTTWTQKQPVVQLFLIFQQCVLSSA